MKSVRLPRIILFCAILGVLFYFVACATLFLENLGLETNEAFEPLHALQMLRLCFSERFPASLMVSPYEAHFISYLLCPLFAIFGPSVFISRFIFVFFSLLTLLSVFYLMKRWFGKGPAFIALLLLGININFFRATRAGGLHDEIVLVSLLWSAMALAQLYADRKQKSYLCASGFLCGMAFWVKIISVDFFAACLGSLVLFWRKGFRFIRDSFLASAKDFVLFVSMFLIGASPFILYNILRPLDTFRYLWGALRAPTIFGYNNLAYAENLSLRLEHLYLFLTNSNAPEMLYGVTQDNYYHFILFCASLAGIILYLIFSKREPLSKNRLRFLLVAFVFLFVLLPFVPQQPRVEHLIILFPFFQILIAAFVSLVARLFKHRIISVGLIFCLLAPHATLELKNAVRLLMEIKNGGGDLYFSPVIKDIAVYVKRAGIKKLFALTEYLLDYNISFLTGLEVDVRELYEAYPYDGREVPTDKLADHLYNNEMKNLDKIYIIVRIDGYRAPSAQQALDALSSVASLHGKQTELLHTFSGKGGTPAFELYVFR